LSHLAKNLLTPVANPCTSSLTNLVIKPMLTSKTTEMLSKSKAVIKAKDHKLLRSSTMKVTLCRALNVFLLTLLVSWNDCQEDDASDHLQNDAEGQKLAILSGAF